MQIMNMTAIVTRPRARDDGVWGEGEGRQGSTAAGSALALAQRNLRPRRFAYATSEEAPKLKSSPSRGSCVLLSRSQSRLREQRDTGSSRDSWKGCR